MSPSPSLSKATTGRVTPLNAVPIMAGSLQERGSNGTGGGGSGSGGGGGGGGARGGGRGGGGGAGRREGQGGRSDESHSFVIGRRRTGGIDEGHGNDERNAHPR